MMSDVKWIKITTNIFDDEKIRLLETLPDSDMIIIIWFKLLILCGKCNSGGLIYLTRDIPYNAEMLSTILRRPINSVRLALNEFQKLGMIEVFNDFIQIINWEKHQNLQLLQDAKEKTRIRVQKHRELKKLECNVTVTKSNAIDKIRLDIDKKEKEEKKRGFQPPSLSEIQDYLNERQVINFNANQFFDFYQAKNWYVGKNKMSDWQAAVRTWIRRDEEKQPKKMSDDEILKSLGIK